MIQSMTGFGRGEASGEEYRVTVEMKSVNHRYLDLSIHIPRQLNSFEAELRNQVRERICRGKTDVYVNFEKLGGSGSCIRCSRETAEAYLFGIQQLSEDFGLPCNVSAEQLSRFPDVFSVEEPDIEEELFAPLAREAVGRALDALAAARAVEGKKLQEDVEKKLGIISETVSFIEEKGPEILDSYRTKLRDKVTELLGDTTLDEGVLATELVIYADKTCVDEEIVRLRTHLEHMKKTLGEGERIGRKLDFITQEMNREANTILSKSSDIEISEKGILLKTEIEKIREQIQNIE